MTTTYTKEQLLALFNSSDPAERKDAMAVLHSSGLKPQEYVRWTVEQKINKILELQAASKGGAAGAKAGGAKAGTKAGTKAANPAAAKAAASDDSATVPTVDLSEVLEILRTQQEQIGQLQASLEELGGFIREGHWLGLQTAMGMGVDLSDASAHGSLLLADEGNADG